MLESGNADEAIRLAVERVAAWAAEPEPPTICVMAPTLRLRDEVARALGKKGIETATIEADSIDSADSTAVRVSTMHRAKGLEFDRVAVLAQSVGTGEDDQARQVYVSLTRAKTVALLVR